MEYKSYPEVMLSTTIFFAWGQMSRFPLKAFSSCTRIRDGAEIDLHRGLQLAGILLYSCFAVAGGAIDESDLTFENHWMVDLLLPALKAINPCLLSFITEYDGTWNISTAVGTPKRHQAPCDT